MSLEQFIDDDVNVDLSKINKSTYQILVAPNITSASKLDKDSFVLVLENVIKSLNKIRDDLFFHIPITKITKRLDFPNTKQHVIKLPSFPNTMRAHYDVFTWNNFLDARKIEMDMIWTHLPEQASNLKNHQWNYFGTDIPIIGYSHWIESKEFNPTFETSFYHNNISGMLQMEKCGLNTQTQIDAILEEAKEYYTDKVIDQLRDIMIPLYLGIETDRISKDIVEDTEKIIAFNHRPNDYRGWKPFVNLIKNLRNQRQDFKVFCSMMTTNAHNILKSHIGEDYRDFFDFDGPESRDEYMKKLSRCRVGFHAGSRWAMSSQDGLCNGVPYVFEMGKETGELFGNKMKTGFTSFDDAETLIHKMLDDNEWRNEQSKIALEHCSNVHTWENRIKPFNNMITEQINKLKSEITSSGTRRDDIVNFIKNRKRTTTKELRSWLGWGKQLGFRRYRNYLRSVEGIHTTVIDKKEYYIWNK